MISTQSVHPPGTSLSCETDDIQAYPPYHRNTSSISSKSKKQTSFHMPKRTDSADPKKTKFPEIFQVMQKISLIDNEELKKRPFSTPKQLQLPSPYEIYLKTEIDDRLISGVQGKAEQNHQLQQLLGKVKRDRKDSDVELLVIENRVKMLMKEEDKTKRRIEEIKKKSSELSNVKQRHARDILKKEEFQREEQIKQSQTQEQVEGMRTKLREQRIESVNEHLLRNYQQYAQTKKEQEIKKQIIQFSTQKEVEENARLVKQMRKKQAVASQKLKEQRAGIEKILERLQEDIEIEAQRKLDNDLKIQRMEAAEQQLIKKLQKSQQVQQQTFLHLQDIINSKPQDIIQMTKEEDSLAEQMKQTSTIKHNHLLSLTMRNRTPIKKLNLTEPSEITEQQQQSFVSTYQSIPFSSKLQQRMSPLFSNIYLDKNLNQSSISRYEKPSIIISNKKAQNPQSNNPIKSEQLESLENNIKSDQIQESIHIDNSQSSFKQSNSAQHLSQNVQSQNNTISSRLQLTDECSEIKKGLNTLSPTKVQFLGEDEEQQITKTDQKAHKQLLSKSANDIILSKPNKLQPPQSTDSINNSEELPNEEIIIELKKKKRSRSISGLTHNNFKSIYSNIHLDEKMLELLDKKNKRKASKKRKRGKNFSTDSRSGVAYLNSINDPIKGGQNSTKARLLNNNSSINNNNNNNNGFRFQFKTPRNLQIKPDMVF